MATSRKNKKTKRVDASDWMTNLIVLGFVVIFTLAGLALLVAFVQVNVLTCTRLEPSQFSCVLESKLLGVLPLSSTSLPGLRGARVVEEITESTDTDDEGHTRTSRSKVYWVALMTDGSEVALDPVRSGRIGSKQQTVNEINAFVRSRAAGSLRAYSDWTPLFFVWCPLLLLVPGLLLLIRTVKKIGAKFTPFRNVHKPMARLR